MDRNSSLKPLAQALRRNQTAEEGLLWYQFLSKYPLRFRRQYTIGNYIVDFYCHKAKLVIELDGSQHYEPKAQKAYADRTAYLESLGLCVLRYSNLDIRKRLRPVCEDIHRVVLERTGTPVSE